MEYVTLPVTDFFEQVGILKTCTTSLKKTTEELGGIQRNLVESNRQVVQIAHRIENLSLQQKQAREKQDEQLASILAAQMESLKDQNLNSAQNAILLDNQRKQMAEKRLEDEKQRKLRQLILTFNSLKNALKEIKKEPDYFDRYVWLSNLNYCMSVNSLAPTELGTLSDIEFATSTIEEFGQEWSNSKNLLSENDRTDINSFTRIRQQLINDSPELEKERANISQQNRNLKTLQYRISEWDKRRGYSRGLVLFLYVMSSTLAGSALIFGVLSSAQILNPDLVSLTIPTLILAGVLFYLAYGNNKSKRLSALNSKLEGISRNSERNRTRLALLEENFSKNKADQDAILKRHPVLLHVTYPG